MRWASRFTWKCRASTRCSSCPVPWRSGAANLVNELAGSCLLGSGQFCTCPNLFVLFAGDAAESFIAELKAQFDSRPCGTLLSEHVLETLAKSVAALREAGAEFVTGGQAGKGPGFCFQNTLLRVSGGQFLKSAERLQTEAFGNATLAVVVDGLEQAKAVAARLEGSLTASLYSAADGSDDSLYDALAPILRRRAGRLLNDKMPTGVAVSPAMNHGGPFPATGHPGFTAVGIPASLRRFAMLECYDNVRPQRLPAWLHDQSPNGTMWRYVDGKWTQGCSAQTRNRRESMTSSTTATAAEPYFQTAFPIDEFARRRAAVADAIGNGVAVLQGMPATGAFDLFRQDNDFFYLSGVETPHAYLTIDGRTGRSVLYLLPVDPVLLEKEGAELNADEAESGDSAHRRGRCETACRAGR